MAHKQLGKEILMPSRRCGWCGQRGHNRRSCPELKKEIRDNPNGFWAEREKIKNANKSKRKCSYCSTEGHTKRTCEKLKLDRKAVAQKSSTWRAQFVTLCNDFGFGIGSLVKFIDPDKIDNNWRKGRIKAEIDHNGCYGIVVDFRNRDLDHRQITRYTQCVQVRFPNGSTKWYTLPVEFLSIIDSFAAPLIKIAGKTKKNSFINSVNNDWLLGLDSPDYFLRA